jgi:hypothetical protein
LKNLTTVFNEINDLQRLTTLKTEDALDEAFGGGEEIGFNSWQTENKALIIIVTEKDGVK